MKNAAGTDADILDTLEIVELFDSDLLLRLCNLASEPLKGIGYMAFKRNTFHKSVSENPALHFKTLTKRQIPDVMPHQKEMLEKYAMSFRDADSGKNR